MKFCKYCGTQIDDAAKVCPNCKKVLTSTPNTGGTPGAQNTGSANGNGTNGKGIGASLGKLNKKLVALGGAALLILIVVIVAVSSSSVKCKSSGCNNKPVSGSDYCYSHKCAISTCEKASLSYSNYCVTHYWLYDDDADSYNNSSTNYVSSSELKISTVTLTTKSNYIYAEGSITNNSDTTVTYVKIKGSFTTKSGTVVDTDWTYAVGSEGLEPGESCKWKLSVEKDSSIKDCTVTILDFDY